jgi:hypothetical protein
MKSGGGASICVGVVCAVFYSGIVAAAVFFYPASWASFWGAGDYGYELDSFLLVGLLSLAFLVAHIGLLLGRGLLSCAAIVFCVAVIIGSVAQHTAASDALRWIGRVICPVAVAVTVSGTLGPLIRLRFLPWCLTLLWMANLILLLFYGNLSGVCGNPNWTAATVTAALPWAIIALWQLLGVPSDGAYRTRCWSTGPLVAASFLIAVTLVGIRRTGCRATAVAVFVYLCVRALEGRARKTQLTAVFGIAALGCALMLAKKQSLERLNMADVRLPLWRSTIAMVAAAPLLGHGADRFEQSFPEFKSAELNARIPVTRATAVEHPHNELLHVAATLGLPAASVWLYMLGAAVRRAPATISQEATRFSLVTLFIHGCFDRTLATSPSSVLFLLFFGVCLADSALKGPLDRLFDFQRGLLVNVVAATSQALALLVACVLLTQSLKAQNELQRATFLSNSAIETKDQGQMLLLGLEAQKWADQASMTLPASAWAHTLAGTIASEILRQPSRGEREFEEAVRLAPRSQQPRWLLGRAKVRALLADSHATVGNLGAPESTMMVFRTVIEDYPTATRIRHDELAALWLVGRDAMVVTRGVELESLYRSLFLLDCFVDGAQPAARLGAWHEAATHDCADLSSEIDTLTDWLYVQDVPILALECFEMQYPLIDHRLRTETYERGVTACIRSAYQLRASFPPDEDPGRILEQIRRIRIVDNLHGYVRPPAEVWARLEGSARDVAFLLATIQQLNRHTSFVAHLGDEYVTGWQEGNDVRLVSIRQLREVTIPIRAFDEQWGAAIARLAAAQDASGMQVSVVATPYSFAPRLLALSAVVSSDPLEPLLFPDPVVACAMTRMLFGNRVPVAPAKEPFHSMELQLQSGSN